jgi:hypothetical protein
MLFLSGVLAFVITLRLNKVDVWIARNWESAWAASSITPEQQTPSPPRMVPVNPPSRDSSTLTNAIRDNFVAPTPIPITPIYVPPITHLRVEASRWSNRLYVPVGQCVGIKFSLGRIRVERDGVIGGTLYRSAPIVPVRDGIALRPLASLDRTPRVVWFNKEIRVLRFISLEKNQAEEVEVFWKKGNE